MSQVEQQTEQAVLAEEALSSLGFPSAHVDCHGEDLARVQVGPAELEAMLEPIVREGLVEELQRLGFRYVTVDLAVKENNEAGAHPPF